VTPALSGWTWLALVGSAAAVAVLRLVGFGQRVSDAGAPGVLAVHELQIAAFCEGA